MNPHSPKEEQKGKAFERLVAAVQKKLDPEAAVEWDVWRKAKSGARHQFDVLVRGREGSKEILVVIEVKDRNEKIDVAMLGSFHLAAIGITATHKAMVSNIGFTEDALLEGKEHKIACCVLRPAKDSDWEGYLRGLEVTIQPRKRIYLDAEIELVDGTNVPVTPGGMRPITQPEGGETFFDRIVEGALAGKGFDDGVMVEIEMPPGYTVLDDNPSHISKLRCRPA